MRRFRASWVARHRAFLVAGVLVLLVALVAWSRDRRAASSEADAVDCVQLRDELHRLSGSVRALDGATGHVLWQAPTGWTDARPSVAGRRVFVAGTDFSRPDTEVEAIDIDTGSVRWRHGFDRARPSRPLPVGDVVLVPVVRLTVTSATSRPDPAGGASTAGRGETMAPTADSQRLQTSVVVLDALSGAEVRSLSYRVLGFPEALTSLPGGTAILGRDAHVALVELRTGVERWSVDLDATTADAPGLINGVVVLRDQQGSVYGFDVATGRKLWQRPGARSTRLVDNRGPRPSPLVLVATDDELTALDPRTGDEVWTVDVTVTAELYVLDDGSFHVVVTPADQPFGTRLLSIDAATGQVRWTADAGTRVGPRVIAGDRALVALVGDPARLVAYDRATGVEQWRADAAGALGPSLSFAGGRFVVATENGAVRAVTQDGRDAWIDSSSRNAVNPPVVDGPSVYVSASTPLDRRSDDLESFFLRC